MENIFDIFNSDVKFPVIYELPFYNYDNKLQKISVINKKVKIVFAGEGRIKVIICEFDEGYQDFYYNGLTESFKQLTFSNDTGIEDDDDYKITFRESWKQESVGIKCPKEYANMYSCM